MDYIAIVEELELKLSTIMKMLHEFPLSEVMNLGVHLDIPYDTLKVFRIDNMTRKEMLIEIINYWLETDSRKSWIKLAEALDYCDCSILAMKIRQQQRVLIIL